MNPVYELDEKQRAVAEKAAKVAREAIAPEAAAVDREGLFPKRAVAALGGAGLLGLALPPQAGGLGEGPRTFAAVVEEVAKACASSAMVYVMHVAASNVVAAKPPAVDGAALLAGMASGRHLTTLAFSERGSRSHFWAPVSKERLEHGKALVVAEKSFVTSAAEADSYVMSVLAADAKGPTDSTLYLVRRDARGVKPGDRFDGMGLRGNGSSPVRLEVELDPGDRVSEPGKGFGVMLENVLPWFTLGTAAMAVGTAEAAVKATAAHLGNARFEHLGEPLSSLPTLRADLARMRILTDRARAQLAFTAHAMERPGPHTMAAVLQVKAQAAEAAQAVTELGMHACGGAAYARKSPVERHFRDARAAAVMAPTSDQLFDFIGRAELGLPLF